MSASQTLVKPATRLQEACWRNAVIYEIAVISFQDSNGDGRGDLPGLLQRIEYIKWLGVGAVWLTPIYKTPNQDFGYDIADFCAIDPQGPFEKLVKGFDLGRDPERAPLRWDETEAGGFTTGERWLSLSEERSRNIEAQRRDAHSLLHLYRELIDLRRKEPCLRYGEYRPRRAQNDIFSFARTLGKPKSWWG